MVKEIFYDKVISGVQVSWITLYTVFSKFGGRRNFGKTKKFLVAQRKFQFKISLQSLTFKGKPNLNITYPLTYFYASQLN